MGSMDFSRVKRVSCALTTILVAAQALAAPAPSIVPGSARPDMVERRNDSENLRPAVGGAALISMPKHAGKSIAGKAEFVLKGVTLDGATVFTPEEMQALYQEKIDQKISLGRIERHRRRYHRLLPQSRLYSDPRRGAAAARRRGRSDDPCRRKASSAT